MMTGRYYTSHAHGLGGISASPADLARFESQVRLADEALAELPSYAYRLRARAMQERASIIFGSTATADMLDELADQMEAYSLKGGPAALAKAVEEGSFTRLRQLQATLKNIVANAQSEGLNLADIFLPRRVREFITIVIVGSVVDFGQGARAVLEEGLESMKTARKVAEGVSTPWGLAVVGLVAVAALVWKFKE